MDKETYQAAFTVGDRPRPLLSSSPWISYGLSFDAACAMHAAETFHVKRIYILASGSLSRNTGAVSRLETTLSNSAGESAVVGVTKGIRSHSYYSDILEIIGKARSARTDCLVTLGAGSLTDAAKVVTIALANDVVTVEDLETLYFDSPTLRDPMLPATIPIICIPTSLSAGEYTPNGGATNDETHHKHSFRHPSMQPRLVILDPELSKTTPEHIWLSTGIKAVDHCVEGICSIKANPEGDEMAEHGLRKLLPGLLRTKAKPEDLDPRLQCQLGAVDAIGAVLLGTPMGASHGIGHQLGPLGVGHGETSCILLPDVCRLNAPINGTQQRKVLSILWNEPLVAEILAKAELYQGYADLGDVLDTLFKELGMPRSLKDVGVGRDKLESLATGSLTDRWCKTNPKPLTEKDHVLEILQAVAGQEES